MEAPAVTRRRQLQEDLEWGLVDAEQQLCEGSLSSAPSITCRKLLDVSGFTGRMRAEAQALGLQPQHEAALTLYRLGWVRLKPSHDLLGDLWTRGETPRPPRPGFAVVVRRRLRDYLASPVGEQSRSLRPLHLVEPLQLAGLVDQALEQLLESELTALGWHRCTYTFPALHRSQVVWERAKLSNPSMPCGSPSSGRAGTQRAKENLARRPGARKGIPPTRSARGLRM